MPDKERYEREREKAVQEKICRISKEVRGKKAPHISELAEALADAFGGPRAFAQKMHEISEDPDAPAWLRMRANGIVVSVIQSAAKVADTTATEYDLLSDEDLQREARLLLGVGDG